MIKGLLAKLGLVVLGVAALTACSLVPAAQQSAQVPAVAPPAAQAPGPAAPAPAEADPAAGQGVDLGQRSEEGGYWPLSLQLGQNGDLGQVVVDGQGFTLYRFDKDDANPSQSNCSGTCALRWPPVLANERISFSNLDPSVIGTVERQDGTQQVTLDGWPLYRYIKDVVPGQATGEGVDRTWFVVAPDGSKAGGGHS